eukprot:CFRG2486T1
MMVQSDSIDSVIIDMVENKIVTATPSDYTEAHNAAATTIQVFYRQYKLRQRFTWIVKRGMSHSGMLDALDHKPHPLEGSLRHLAESKNNFLSSTELDKEEENMPQALDIHPLTNDIVLIDFVEMRQGIYKFNLTPKNGIKYLVEKKVIDNDPTVIALLFQNVDKFRISKAMIGEYLGELDDFNLAVLAELTHLLDFKDQTFCAALRQYLSYFKLPGEAQKIDRMMEVFANRYFQSNSHRHGNDDMPLKSSDATYILAFSSIMLNTDAHNPNVKRKMTLEDFIRNNRGINDNEDLPEPFLRQIYDQLLRSQLMTTDLYMENMKTKFRDSANIFEAVVSSPCRYLIQSVDCQLFDDVARTASSSHHRHLCLFNDLLLITKKNRADWSIRDSVALHGSTFLSFNSEKMEGFQIMDSDNRIFGPFVCDNGISNEFISNLRNAISDISSVEEAKNVCPHLRPTTHDRVMMPILAASDDKLTISQLSLNNSSRLSTDDSPSSTPRRRRATSVSKGLSNIRRALSTSSPSTKRSLKVKSVHETDKSLFVVPVSASLDGEQ